MPRKPLILIACLALGAIAVLPGSAAASTNTAAARSAGQTGKLVNSLAAGACAQERHKIGKRSFRKRYGRKSTRTCIKRNRKDARAAVTAGTAECQLELDDYGDEDFYMDWDSFEDCVADYSQWVMDGGTFEDDGSMDPGADEDPGVDFSP
jgi:hypothetical protein